MSNGWTHRRLWNQNRLARKIKTISASQGVKLWEWSQKVEWTTEAKGSWWGQIKNDLGR